MSRRRQTFVAPHREGNAIVGLVFGTVLAAPAWGLIIGLVSGFLFVTGVMR